MTYGEACVAERNSIVLEKGVWVQKLYVQDKAKQMSKEDAGRYYNTKLFAYWMDQLDDNLSILKKSQILSALMFGNVDKYKIFKEK